MEIEGDDSRTRLKPDSTIHFGRGHGFNSTNRAVSRRHITFQMAHYHEDEQPTVRFEVVGMNPICVRSRKSGKVEIFRRFSKGEMKDGDMFCVSAENPVWFTVKRVEFDEEDGSSVNRELGLENELDERIESSHGEKIVEELSIESVDISIVDPIKEFGLVVTGHEFDAYAEKMVHDARKWEWYIEEPKQESVDDDVGGRKGKKRMRRKGKKGKENDDEEWTRESEEEKELLTSSRKVQKPVYSTRSKDRYTPSNDRKIGKPSSGPKKRARAGEENKANEDEHEDEDDETLGGFIVNDVSEDEDEMDQDDEVEEFFEDEEE